MISSIMNKWDDIWSRSTASELWTLPDPDLNALIPKLKKEGIQKVLDLGCGIGRHTVLFAASGFTTSAIDSSKEGVKKCGQWLSDCGLEAHVTHADMERLDFKDCAFDFVMSWNVIYHGVRSTIENTLAEIYRITRSGSFLYLTLNSTRNHKYGVGNEIEPDTFDDPKRGHGHHIHHYSTRSDVDDLLSKWQIVNIKESEEWLGRKVYEDTWHWMIFARKP